MWYGKILAMLPLQFRVMAVALAAAAASPGVIGGDPGARRSAGRANVILKIQPEW